MIFSSNYCSYLHQPIIKHSGNSRQNL